jgi:hypothetical protein
MNRAVANAGFLSVVLHDVAFAACGPADLVDIMAQHPERGHIPWPNGSWLASTWD